MSAFNIKVGDLSPRFNWIPPKSRFLEGFLSKSDHWSICQPIWDSKFIKSINGFDLTFDRMQDVEVHTRALIENARVITFPNHRIDSHYRIGEYRLTHKTTSFLQNSVIGSICYYKKFFPLLSVEKQKLLTGTLIQTMSSLAYLRSDGRLSTELFKDFAILLIQSCNIRHHRLILMCYFKLIVNMPIYPRGGEALFRLLLRIN